MTQRCLRCKAEVYEDEPGVWLHLSLVGRECIAGEVRPVLRPQWLLEWVGLYGDTERFHGRLVECMAEVRRIDREGLLMEGEEYMLTPPVESQDMPQECPE